MPSLRRHSAPPRRRRRASCAACGDRRSRAVLRSHRLEAHRQQRRAPTTVAAAGAEPGELASTTAMRSAGSRLVEVVRRPQPGVAGRRRSPRRRDVARQCSARRRVVIGRKRVEPERKLHVGRSSAPTLRNTIDDAPTLAPMLPTTGRLVPRPVERLGGALLGWPGLDGSRRRADGRRSSRIPTLPIGAAWGRVITLLVSLIAAGICWRPSPSYDWPIAVYVAIAGRHRLRPGADVVLVRQPSLGYRPVPRRCRFRRPMGRCRLGPAHVAVPAWSPRSWSGWSWSC